MSQHQKPRTVAKVHAFSKAFELPRPERIVMRNGDVYDRALLERNSVLVDDRGLRIIEYGETAADFAWTEVERIEF